MIDGCKPDRAAYLECLVEDAGLGSKLTLQLVTSYPFADTTTSIAFATITATETALGPPPETLTTTITSELPLRAIWIGQT